MVRTRDGGQVDGGEAVDAQAEVAGRADHHQREDEHRREDRAADADLGELLHVRALRGDARCAGRRRLPGPDDDRLAGGEALEDLDRSPVRRPVVTRFSTALPSSTPITFSMPAKVTMAAAGTSTSRPVRLRRRSPPLAKAPGRSAAVGFGTSASTSSVRLLLADRRAEPRDAALVHASGSPSTVRRTALARPDAAASRSGTARRSRSGLMRTSVTTGAPAARYSPTAAWRSRMAPSNGARSTVSASCCRASSSSVRRSARSPGGCAPPRARPGSRPPRPWRPPRPRRGRPAR